VAGERRLRILSRLVGSGTRELETSRLCEVGAEVTGMSGAGIMLMSGDLPHGSVCTTNKVSALIEELQYALGEGPCVDAYHEDRPVLEPDLADPDTPRWLAFTGPALDAGVRAVFGFPLRVGAVHLGALNLYRDRPGPLTDHQHADALVMADVAAQAVLVLQANAPPGKLAAALDASGDFHYVVHQAAGMVAAQLHVSVAHAVIRLRAYAFGNNRPLTEVAQDVVARTLRFDTDTSGKDPGP
jgi:GAF domain-containing protein